MPARFRNFLRKKKSSRGSVRKSRQLSQTHRVSNNSSVGVAQYEYGIDHGIDHSPSPKSHSAPRSPKRRKQRAGNRWSVANAQALTMKDRIGMQRSSKSLGDAEVNGRLISTSVEDEIDDSFNVSSEEDDYFDQAFIERKYSGINGQMNGSGNRNDLMDEETDVSSEEDAQELDRACVRLDGIEVYAIVSALTCATAINCFDNYVPTPLSDIVRERAVFTLLSEMCYFLSGALGMMTGLHATLIFSLVTMYGRTALGIDRDDAFNDFFSNTGPARFNGFWSFKLSLYCFMTQLSFLIGSKFFFEPLRPLVLLATGYLAYTNLYCDAEDVLSAAGVIYSTTPTPPPPEEEDSEPGDRRKNFQMGGKRGSLKKAGMSLSTRNFGVDTSGTRRSSFVFSKNNGGFTSTPNFGGGSLGSG